MKKFTVVALIAVLAISGIMAVMLSPFHMSNVRASGGASSHSVRANYSITRLPRRNVSLGDLVGVPRQGNTNDAAYFALVRSSGSGAFVVGVSHPVGTLPLIVEGTTTFENAGVFQYRFFHDFATLQNGAMAIHERNSENISTYRHFHTHDITVMQDEFLMTLPENSADFVPNIVVPGQQITFPLPSSFIDRSGRDLFTVRRDPDLNLYAPYLEQLQALYPTVTQGTATDLEHLGALRNRVFQDMTVQFFGNDGAIESQAEAGNVTGLTGIADPRTRTFTIPPQPANNYYAEFTFNHNGGNVTVASYRTNNIIVENVGIPLNQIMGNDVGSHAGADNQRRNQIRFEFNPSVAFTPSNLRLNMEVQLPGATVNISRETDTESRAFNRVDFSQETFTAFSFVRVEILPGIADGAADANDPRWRLARTPEWRPEHGENVGAFPGSFFHRVEDFTFIPTELGEYRFTYFTTTVFGAGFDHTPLMDQVVRDPATWPAGATATWPTSSSIIEQQRPAAGQQSFIRFNPFEPLFVRTDTVAPTIRWTEEYAWGAIPGVTDSWTGTAGTAPMRPVTRPDPGATPPYAGGTPINPFEAPDHSNYLPGSGSNSRTEIATSLQANHGDNRHQLILPALMGHDNATPSNRLVYNITIRRTVEGVQHRHSITWASTNANVTAGAGNTGPQMPYDPTSRLVLDFEEGEWTNGVFSGSLDELMRGVTGSDASFVGFYDITVFARDERLGGILGLPSVQLLYSFNVVRDTAFTMDESRPEFHGGIQMRQTAYYEDDTISFRRVNVSDNFTDDRNIDVAYWLSFGTELVDVTEDLVEAGGNLTLVLKAGESDIADQLLAELEAAGGFMEVRLVVVARNFFAMHNGITHADLASYGFPNDPIDLDNAPAGINFIGTTFRLYSLDFGYASTIAGADLASPDFGRAINDHQWSESLTAANIITTGTNPNPTGEIRQNRRVYLPEFRFFYEYFVGMDADIADSGLASSIQFEVIQPLSGRRLGLNRSTVSTQVPVWGVEVPVDPTTAPLGLRAPELSNRPGATGSVHDLIRRDPMVSGSPVVEHFTRMGGGQGSANNSLFFIPNEIGVHTVIARVTNAGGNVTIFVADILVSGQAVFSVGIVGGVDTMRVAETASLPTVVVTINGMSFRTNNNFDVIADFGSEVRVGSYRIEAFADNQSPVTMTQNNFTPSFAGRYTFNFIITIDHTILTNNPLLPEMAGVIATENIIAERSFDIVVSQLNEGDVRIGFMRDEFRFFYDNPVAGGHVVTGDSDVDRIHQHNILPQLVGSQAGTGVTSFNVSDNTLRLGLEQVGPAADRVFQYGVFFLPDWQVLMAAGLTPPVNFDTDVETHVTVRAPRAGADDYLLDTRNDDETNWVQDARGQRLHFFRPQGLLRLTAAQADLPAGQRDLSQADRWPLNTDVYVDGEYVITYTASFQNVVTVVEFRILIGDVAMPRIDFTLSEEQQYDLFNRPYRVGDRDRGTFHFDTNFVVVHANGGKTDFSPFYIASNLRMEVLRPDSTAAIVGPDWEAGDIRQWYSLEEPTNPSDPWIGNALGANANGSNYVDEAGEVIRWREGRQRWDVNLTQAGEYRFTFRIRSEAGVETTLFRTITVETEQPPRNWEAGEIWGWILIVVASGLFLAVLVYFIRTGRQTKFQTSGNVKKIAEDKPDQV
ncbi:MAG: hypothetical protein FWE38_01525 [Firmicutes bacterium]|nr:hypothetical protein [Bacillota bacterium]